MVDSITLIIIAGIIIWILQTLLGFFQMRNFKSSFVEMRKKGKVVIGFKKGFLFSGTMVLVRINNSVEIEEIRCMQGVTVFARFKELKGLEGKNLLSIKDEDLEQFNKLIRKAMFKAVENYKKHIEGGEESENVIENENLEIEQLT
jgi:DNA-binding transcriptional regulator of glucitol operon